MLLGDGLRSMTRGHDMRTIETVMTALPHCYFQETPFSANTLLKRTVCNMIASFIYARCFKYNNPGLIRLDQF
jgi:hypothetical protein